MSRTNKKAAISGGFLQPPYAPKSAIPTAVPIVANPPDKPKQSFLVFPGTCRKENLVLVAVARRSGPAAEINSPKLINHNRLSGGVLDRPHELPVFRAETIDRAREVDIVADQQRAAQRSKILRRDRKSPGLVQRLALRQTLHKRSGLGENINVTSRAASRIGERHVDLSTDVLDAKGREVRGQAGISKRSHEIETAVIHIHFIVGSIGGEQEISRGIAGDGQPSVDRSRTPVVDRDDRLRGI